MSAQELTEEDFKVMSLRVKHLNWQVRKRAYQQLLDSLQQVTSLKQQFKINTQIFTAMKVTSILNNLTEEKHPTLVLKGLQCVLTIINLNGNAIKYFNQLVSEGLEKFPLLTQQRKHILEKFMELLYFFKDQQHIVATLNSKLSLPNQKAVLWTIEVIGALQLNALRPKLIELSKKHPKIDVKELAAEIAGQLEGEEPTVPVKKEENRSKVVTRPAAVKKEQPRRVTDLLEKLHHYEQMSSKEQQRFSEELLEVVNHLCGLPMSPQLTNFSYFIQLMIEDNNQIISSNGVKLLTALIDSRSSILPSSYPLLFIFRKFKLHKTHATNLNLLKLVQALICSNRSNDLINAILEGMGGVENKGNIKYGCIISFIRIFCYFYGEEKLFKNYCIGQYKDLGQRIQNRKYVEKMLFKCAESIVKEKDKEYIPAIERIKQITGMKSSAISDPKSTKSIQNESKVATSSKGAIDSNLKTQTVPKLSQTSKSSKSRTALILSPQGQLNKILELTKSQKCTEPLLRKAMEKCFKCLSECVQEQVYDMFFYCEILESVIDNYEPDQRWDEMISQFLIDYLKIVSSMEFKEGKKKSKIVKNGVDYLLQIGVTKLALGKQLLFILQKLNESVGFDVIFKSLGDLLVMQGQACKKKNKKYLNRWLEEKIPQEYLDSQYDELKQAIERKKKIEQPPSIINIPSYQELKGSAEPKIEDRPIFKKKLEQKYKREEQQELRRLQEERIRKQQQQHFMKKKREQYEQYRIKQQYENDYHAPKACEKLQILQNADISHIERIQEQETDRLDEKWQYFLNKKGLNLNPSQHQEDTFKIDREQYAYEEQKFNFSQKPSAVEPQQIPSYKFQKHHYQQEHYENEFKAKPETIKDVEVPSFKRHEQNENSDKEEEQPSFQIQEESKFKLEKSQIKPEVSDSGIKRYYDPEDDEEEQQKQEENNIQTEQFKYVCLDSQRIIYMLANSGKSFSHLRTLVFNPFRKSTNRHAFLRQLTHLIQSQKINKPQPFKSLLLLVILLFTEIRNDKSVINPLQFLYQYMAQMCTNNEFLKIIIGLYHCVIEESEEGDRKMLLTILNKSIVRIMPYVQNAWQMLKDFQQFYQIGQLVYFEMYAEEYMQIRETLEGSDSLEVVVGKACEEQGQNILAMVEGWLDTNFKKVVKAQIQIWVEAQNNDQ